MSAAPCVAGAGAGAALEVMFVYCVDGGGGSRGGGERAGPCGAEPARAAPAPAPTPALSARSTLTEPAMVARRR